MIHRYKLLDQSKDVMYRDDGSFSNLMIYTRENETYCIKCMNN